MQEIIVYRSPAEAIMWQFLTSADGFVFITFFATFVITFLVVNRILDLFPWYRRLRTTKSYIPLTIALASSVLVAYFM